MQNSDPNTFIGLGIFGIIVVVFVLIFFFAGKKAKKALAEFAASRGLVVQPIDEGNEIERQVTRKLGIPEGGIYQDIVRLPISSGEGWLFTKAPDPKKNDPHVETSSGSPHQYIVVFMDIPVTGRTFAGKASPMPKSGIGLQLVEFILAKDFGAKGVHFLDTAADYPDFTKVYNVFTEDEAGARSVVLSSGVISCLMNHPRKEPVNISFTPNGFGLDIEKMLKSRQEIELFVQWTDDLARVLGH